MKSSKKVLAQLITTMKKLSTEEVEFQVKEAPNPALPEGCVRNNPGEKKVFVATVETVTYTHLARKQVVVKFNTITTQQLMKLLK